VVAVRVHQRVGVALAAGLEERPSARSGFASGFGATASRAGVYKLDKKIL
jgi:hypothetical protein